MKNIKRRLFLEKLQIVVGVAATLSLVYWGIQSWFIPADPLQPIALLPAGNFGGLVLLGVVFWILTALLSLVTTFSRPEGAIAAALIAIGGLSLRSNAMRALVWNSNGSMSGIFVIMIVELLIMGVMLLVGVGIMIGVRRLVKMAAPRLIWRDQMANLTGQQVEMLEKVNSRFNSSWFSKDPVMGYLLKLIANKSSDKSEAKPDRRTKLQQREQLQRAAGCLVTGIAVGLLLMSLLLRSTTRGQVVFALFAAFMLSQIIAQHLYSTRSLLIACVTPIIAAIAVYALGAYSAVTGGANFWAVLAPQFQSLPIDWFAVGIGGSVLGLWTSDRMREIRVLETLYPDLHLSNDDAILHT
ncbi:MAG: hypothetical protein KAR11_09340 [Phycisphaerae bacterium]|nr:hypothetical protein [Phycisphaerae bacterium]